MGAGGAVLHSGKLSDSGARRFDALFQRRNARVSSFAGHSAIGQGQNARYKAREKTCLMKRWGAVFFATALIESARSKEARYIDSSFEVGKPGYLYNIGTRKYVGLDRKTKKNMVVTSPESAMRLTLRLNPQAEKGGFVMAFSDPEAEAEEAPQGKLLNKEVLDMCKLSNPQKMILGKFDEDASSSFFISPPVLVNENAFYVMSGTKCLSVDGNNLGIVAQACVHSPKAERNRQMFVWVDVDTFNRGIDLSGYVPDPYLAVADLRKIQKAQKDCMRNQGSKLDIFKKMLRSSTTFPLGKTLFGDIDKFLGKGNSSEMGGTCKELLENYGI